MNEKITVTRPDNTQVQADIICFLENTTSGKRYLYYTLNETVGDGANSTVKVYVAKVTQGNPSLDTPITEEDWGHLKGYMSDALKGNTNANVKYVQMSELGTPTIVSEKAIAMPTSYDYINKQRGVYATSVAETAATSPVAETVAPTEPAAPALETPSEVVTPTVEAQVAPEAESAPTPTEPIIPEVPLETTPATPEVAPEAPVSEAPTEPVTETPQVTENLNTESSAVLEPIDLNSIEQKYSEMIETINKLKEQELEAVKRYNATIELSAMHKEQHASYVQTEQVKEGTPIIDTAAPTEVAPAPAVPEPTPVTPQEIETNWFDMPSNN